MDLSVDDVILISDETMHPLKWPLIGVIRVFRGSGGLVRVVGLKARLALLKGPILKIVFLNFLNNNKIQIIINEIYHIVLYKLIKDILVNFVFKNLLYKFYIDDEKCIKFNVFYFYCDIKLKKLIIINYCIYATLPSHPFIPFLPSFWHFNFIKMGGWKCCVTLYICI